MFIVRGGKKGVGELLVLFIVFWVKRIKGRKLIYDEKKEGAIV